MPQLALAASVLQFGAWGLLPEPDPFESKYPPITYLAPWTSVFDTQRAPLEGYILVLTHHGYWVQIAQRHEGNPILVPFETFGTSLNSDTLLFHEAILGRFDVTVIARYFPEFERELPRYLAQG